MTTISPWKKLNETHYQEGRRKLIKRVFELPSGEAAEFNLFDSRPTVCILALTEDKRVIIAKQFRPAQERILLELPGGGIEEGETPEEAIQRELLEETGYAGEVTFVAKSLQSAYDTLVRYNFVALHCKQVSKPNDDPNEPIEVTTLSIAEFKDHLKSAEMTDVATGYLGLEYLGLL